MFHPDLQSERIGEEARSRTRVRSALVCVVSHGPRMEQALGVVWDIHDEGACVVPHCDTRAITGPVELEVEGRKFLANLAWKNDREIGLHFIADLTDEQGEIVHHLRATLAAMKRA